MNKLHCSNLVLICPMFQSTHLSTLYSTVVTFQGQHLEIICVRQN